MRIDHIAIAVQSMDEALEIFRTAWGLEPDSVETVESDGVVEAMLPLGDGYVQLLESTREGSPVARFLERRGQGLHHIAIEVDDIETRIAELRALDVNVIDEAPRPGGRGNRVAFVHPKSTTGVLIELVERPKIGGSEE